MNVFSALMIANLALVMVCVVRARPATLVIALNQVGTLRLSENIKLFGQPAAEGFLPHLVFSPHNLDIAAIIFTISTALLAPSALVSPRVPSRAVVAPPPLPRWALLLVYGFLVLITVATGSLVTKGYSNEAGTINGFTFGAVSALMFSLLLYEAARRVFIRQWRPLAGFIVIAAAMFFTCYSKGSTGLATGFGLTAAVMLWPRDAHGFGRRTIITIVTLATVCLTAYVVRGVRESFFERGFDAVADLLEHSGDSETQRAETGSGIEAAGNGTQYACHLLECIQLYESGIQRDWRSIYNPLIYTFEPSFLLEPLGLTRPLDAPWELADYYQQGGGIYLLGELYWNGGYFCLLVVFGSLMLLSFYCDTRYRSSPFWLMMCAQFAPSAFMGVGYGFNQVIRGAIDGLLVVGAYRLLAQRFRFKAGAPRFSVARPPPVPGTARAGAAKPSLSET